MKYKHTLWGVGLSLLFSLGILSASAASPAGEETVAKETFAVGKGTFLLNGKPFVVKAAEVHYPRIPEPYWEQAKSLLEPLLGSSAAVVFALALLMAGISSTITSGMAAGSIFAGIFGESYHIKDSHSQVGVMLSLGIALLLIFFIGDAFKGLLISQMILSIQLPFTVFLQVSLTSSRRVMGQYVNSKWSTFVLYAIAAIVTVLNIMLLVSELS